jgi:hypothetical protein
MSHESICTRNHKEIDFVRQAESRGNKEAGTRGAKLQKACTGDTKMQDEKVKVGKALTKKPVC